MVFDRKKRPYFVRYAYMSSEFVLRFRFWLVGGLLAEELNDIEK